MAEITLDRLEQTLEELLPLSEGKLYETARYSIEGGKRLRPLLLLSVLETFDKPLEKGLYPAAALEFVHTYSLIHDDLPCMDNDDERRGKPTLHKAYPESHAVLTGDFLLTYAFEVLASAPHLNDSEKLELIRCLSLRGGEKGMIGGQLLDLENFPDREQMYLQKTGALFSCALEFGAILSGVDRGPFQEIGACLGIAFQLMDDLLDGDGVAQLLGKEEVGKRAFELYERARSKIEALPRGAPQLLAITKNLVLRTV